jgi:hypothetical protein
MKFTIREMMLIIFVVAVLLGWLVDHWRTAANNAAREAQWERELERSLTALSRHSPEEMDFDTPNGSWHVFPVLPVTPRDVKPR